MNNARRRLRLDDRTLRSRDDSRTTSGAAGAIADRLARGRRSSATQAARDRRPRRRRRAVDLPDRDCGVDLLLAQRTCDRDSMVPVADEVTIADADQVDRRHIGAVEPRLRDSAPARPGVLLKWVEAGVEVVAAPLAASDLADGYRLHPDRVAGAGRAAGRNCPQIEQVARPAQQRGPQSVEPASSPGALVRLDGGKCGLHKFLL